MQKFLCIHGHFYQPPREDPWLREVLPEGSAAPGLHWNERICRESYGPLGWARRTDNDGHITEIINCYAWMSFNLGPTLLSWMERGNPDAYGRVLAGDRESLERWGHGNAMAQIYHHVIMPLATPLDRGVEVAWGLADFRARFGREAEGMWLSEAAVDTASLEVLAAQGVRFVILAPRQAKAVASLDKDDWSPVEEGNLDVTQAYEVKLPSGKSMSVFFYHGGLSQAVAFERLLEDGENFWNRLKGFFDHRGNSRPTLLALATDGETYGHHFKFGEMALAHVLAQTFFGRDQIELGNFGMWLEKHPPTMQAQLHEPSSWSCVHGVERWRADCGCSTGGHPGWNQQWRGPLREALDGFKASVDAHYHKRGAGLFNDPVAALMEYGEVLAGSQEQKAFAARHCVKGLAAEERQAAWRLLAMQQWALASFASCAWFFDEISRIEPLNGLTYALRAMELCEATGGPEAAVLEAALTAKLAEAHSNFPDLGSGKDLFENMVRPRMESPASLAAQALLTLDFQGRSAARSKQEVAWPGVRVNVRGGTASENAPEEGEMALAWTLEHQEERYVWRWEKDPGGDPLKGRFWVAREGVAFDQAQAFTPEELPWNKLQALALGMADEVEERDWRDQEQKLRDSAYFFLPYQEAQQTQNLEPVWRRLWPTMAWLYARGLDMPHEGGDDPLGAVRQGCVQSLTEFLASQAKDHPDREMVGRRIVAHLLELLQSQPPLWQSAIKVVERTRSIGLHVDWWPVQNLLWRLGALSSDERRAKSLARMIWFKV